jgi:glycosyltransferase involved in cell wall biosynthesis
LLDPLARFGLKILVGPMRRWDYKAAQRPHHMIANSNFTKDQIKKYYGRDSVVVHPPVDIDRFKILNKSSVSRSGFLIAGRQTPYKRFDLAVAACTQLNLPLTVVGTGPDHKQLTKMAGPSIKFVGSPNDKDIVGFFQSAEAFIFPGIDDFGITPVEALAAGTPIIAYKAGGALDYVNSKTGMFFNEQGAESLIQALKKFDTKAYKFSDLTEQASQFSPQQFAQNVHRLFNSFML